MSETRRPRVAHIANNTYAMLLNLRRKLDRLAQMDVDIICIGSAWAGPEQERFSAAVSNWDLPFYEVAPPIVPGPPRPAADLKALQELLVFEKGIYQDLSRRVDSSYEVSLQQARTYYILKPMVDQLNPSR